MRIESKNNFIVMHSQFKEQTILAPLNGPLMWLLGHTELRV